MEKSRGTAIESISVLDILYWVNRGKWIILLCGVLFMSIAYLYENYNYIPTYTATASMVVNAKTTTTINPDGTTQPTANDISLAQRLVSTYTAVMRSNKVMSYVVNDLKLDIPASVIRSYVNLTSLKDTQVLYLTVTCGDPELAQNIANSIMKVAPQAMMETVEIGSINILDNPTLPKFPSPNTALKTSLLAAFLGLAFGVFIVFAFNMLAVKVKHPKDIEESFNISTLGEIPHIKNIPKLMSLDLSSDFIRASGHFVEAFLKLGAIIQYVCNENSTKKIMITSTYANEGKTTVAANLSIAIAKSGRKVLLIDADFRNPNVHKFFNLHSTDYIVDVLTGGAQVSESVITLPIGVSIMPCYHYRWNKYKQFSVDDMQSIIKTLEPAYDYIILDTSPVALTSEAVQISSIIDGAIIVTRQEVCTKNALADTVNSLNKVGTKILGCVMNDIRYSTIGNNNYGKYKNYYNSKYNIKPFKQLLK